MVSALCFRDSRVGLGCQKVAEKNISHALCRGDAFDRNRKEFFTMATAWLTRQLQDPLRQGDGGGTEARSVKMDRRRIALTVGFSLLGGVATSACDESPPSPENLGWLRDECPTGGALVHHAEGRLYLTELDSGQSEFLANGNQPEFSPDGRRVAWIDGTSAKGRLRQGDPTIYVIADSVEPAGGVHWLSDQSVAVVSNHGKEKQWLRVGLDGAQEPIPELTELGTGGYECDVRFAKDGVWSYVADHGWKTSEGRSGRVPGTCSVSLSVDGRTVTSLHNPHKKCDLTAIRPGGMTRVLWWKYAGGYDNHRFASADPRFLVAVDEHHQTMVVMTVDGNRCTRVGTLGRAKHGMYGDWTSTAAVRDQAWLARVRASPTSPGPWPRRKEQVVFVWDSGQSSNTLITRTAEHSLCRWEKQGRARWGTSFELILEGGRALAEASTTKLAFQDLDHSKEGTLELVLAPARDRTLRPATVLQMGSTFELTQVEGGLRGTWGGREREQVIALGTVSADRPTHLAITWNAQGCRAYRDGRKILSVPWEIFPLWSLAETLCVGARADGRQDWSGWIEGVAVSRVALADAEVKASFESRRERLASRTRSQPRHVVGTLLRKRELPPPSLYPNTLVTYDYHVEGQTVSVAHWGILDGVAFGSVRDRELAESYSLALEPWSNHPELQRFQLVGSDQLEEAPWFDGTPPGEPARIP